MKLQGKQIFKILINIFQLYNMPFIFLLDFRSRQPHFWNKEIDHYCKKET